MTEESRLTTRPGVGDAKEADSAAKRCSECELTFDTLAKYKYHRLRLHGAWKAGFRCPDCDATLGSVSNLKRHRKKAHEREAAAESGAVCADCGHVAKDNFHLKVHARKHTGERPFECISCSFGFYKKSDLTRHQKGMGCSGAKFRCSTCSKPFHFKRQLEEHLVWSQSCGVMDFAEDEESRAGPSRYMNPEERPSIARFNISRDHSVVGINYPVDETRYVKRKRRGRCGLCTGCQRTSNCGSCSNCRGECQRTYCKLRDLSVKFRVGENSA